MKNEYKHVTCTSPATGRPIAFTIAWEDIVAFAEPGGIVPPGRQSSAPGLKPGALPHICF